MGISVWLCGCVVVWLCGARAVLESASILYVVHHGASFVFVMYCSACQCVEVRRDILRTCTSS